MYLFLSDQGNCYYMASNDPRYTIVRSPQTGQVTETIKRKLQSTASSRFPKDFSYHWLRATFAYQLYQRLQPLVQEGVLRITLQSGEFKDFTQGNSFIAADALPDGVKFDSKKHGHKAEVIGTNSFSALHIKLVSL